MKTIRLLKDVVGGNGEPLKEGSFHSLNDASADHWLKRGLAVEETPQPEAKDPVEAEESAPRRRKQKGLING